MNKELVTFEMVDAETGVRCRFTQVYLPATDMGHWNCVILGPTGEVLDVTQSVGKPWPGKITLAMPAQRLMESLAYNRAEWQAQGWVKKGG